MEHKEGDYKTHTTLTYMCLISTLSLNTSELNTANRFAHSKAS